MLSIDPKGTELKLDRIDRSRSAKFWTAITDTEVCNYNSLIVLLSTGINKDRSKETCEFHFARHNKLPKLRYATETETICLGRYPMLWLWKKYDL